MIKTVMKYVVNYNKVVDFIYDDKDFITSKIIDYYRDYVLDDSKTNRKKKSLDNIVHNYIDDYGFNEYVKEHINEYSTQDYGIDYYYDMDIILNKIFKKYLYYKEGNITKTKWL
jgi:hypothetical protein